MKATNISPVRQFVRTATTLLVVIGTIITSGLFFRYVAHEAANQYCVTEQMHVA